MQGSHLRAGAWWRRGNLAEAEADAENAAPHPSFMVRPGALTQVEIRLIQDDVEGAERLWHDLGLEQDPMSGRAAVGTRQTRARVRAATGRHEEALQEFLASREMEDAWGIRTPAHSTWRSDTVRLLTTMDRVDEAQALADEDVARARTFGDPRPLGIALRAAAGLAPARVASSRWRSRSASCGPRRRGSSSRSRCSSYGAAQRRAGRRTDARDPLREAVDVAAACGATALAARRTTSSSPPARARAATRSRAAAG